MKTAPVSKDLLDKTHKKLIESLEAGLKVANGGKELDYYEKAAVDIADRVFKERMSLLPQASESGSMSQPESPPETIAALERRFTGLGQKIWSNLKSDKGKRGDSECRDQIFKATSDAWEYAKGEANINATPSQKKYEEKLYSGRGRGAWL